MGLGFAVHEVKSWIIAPSKQIAPMSSKSPHEFRKIFDDCNHDPDKSACSFETEKYPSAFDINVG